MWNLCRSEAAFFTERWRCKKTNSAMMLHIMNLSLMQHRIFHVMNDKSFGRRTTRKTKSRRWTGGILLRGIRFSHRLPAHESVFTVTLWLCPQQRRAPKKKRHPYSSVLTLSLGRDSLISLSMFKRKILSLDLFSDKHPYWKRVHHSSLQSPWSPHILIGTHFIFII